MRILMKPLCPNESRSFPVSLAIYSTSLSFSFHSSTPPKTFPEPLITSCSRPRPSTMQFFPKPSPSLRTPTTDASPSTATNPHLPPPLQSLQSHLTTFLSQVHANPIVSHFKSHLESAVQTLADRAKQVLPPPLTISSRPRTAADFGHAAPLQMPEPVTKGAGGGGGGGGGRGVIKTVELKERLKGIPVYVLSDAEKNMMLVSGVKTGKSLGLLCFKEEDAESLLEQMKAISPGVHEGSQVVSVGLNQVIQLKINDVAFRFIPDSHQVLNAIKVGERLGASADGFPGVPVFLSRSLAMVTQNKRYRPAFLRKEDLEESLYIASQQQNQLNPALRREDVQVCVLEDIITDMKVNSISKWSDLVFIPPGFDISKHIGHPDGSSVNT